MTPPIKLNETVSIGQLIISFVVMLSVGTATFYGVKEQVTRNEERIEMLKEEVEKTQSNQANFETRINDKLDRILQEVQGVRIEVEKKQDRK